MKLLKQMTMAAGVAASMLLAAPLAAEEVTISGSGGQVAQLLEAVFNKSFTAETGIRVRALAATNRASALKAMMASGRTVWDATELNAIEYATASLNGWLAPLDWSKIDPNGMLPDSARLKDAAIAATYSNILAVRTDKMPAGKSMSSWADFWDVKTFPGPRSLQNQPFDNLEFALLADGVAKEDLYKILATPEGIDRAFAKLDEIKPHIVTWWKNGAQAVQLLADGEVHFSSSFNGRISKLQKDGKSIAAIWNGGAVKPSYVAIPKRAPNPEAGAKWISHLVTGPKRAATFASMTNYPFFTKGMYDHVDAAKAKMMPTSPENLPQQFVSNDLFWGANYSKLNERWQDWVAE
jgi:putative spermidine/putrescine transport system substrate-binding protein